MGSPNHRINDTHTWTPFLICIELDVKILPPLLNQVEVRGFNWSTLPIFIIVHQHFGKSMFSNKENGATDQIVYYTPAKSICCSLYEVKWKKLLQSLLVIEQPQFSAIQKVLVCDTRIFRTHNYARKYIKKSWHRVLEVGLKFRFFLVI